MWIGIAISITIITSKFLVSTTLLNDAKNGMEECTQLLRSLERLLIHLILQIFIKFRGKELITKWKE